MLVATGKAASHRPPPAAVVVSRLAQVRLGYAVPADDIRCSEAKDAGSSCWFDAKQGRYVYTVPGASNDGTAVRCGYKP